MGFHPWMAFTFHFISFLPRQVPQQSVFSLVQLWSDFKPLLENEAILKNNVNDNISLPNSYYLFSDLKLAPSSQSQGQFQNANN